MKYLTVLDYSEGTTHIVIAPPDDTDLEMYLIEDMGFGSISNLNWMVHTNLQVNIEEK